VSLIDENENVFAQSSFPWQKVGNMIEPANHAAIASWVASTSTDITRVEISLMEISVDTQPGVNAFMTSLYVNNNVVGVAADVWTVGADCGSSQFESTNQCL